MIYGEGSPRWHCLRVLPQREAACEAWLAQRDVHAFHPVKVKYKHVRGRSVRLSSRYLPGYVFARFPGPLIWHRLKDTCPMVSDAVRTSTGQLAVLDPSDLRLLQRMADVDKDIQDRRAMAARIGKGDVVRLTDGAFEGMEVEVMELRGDKAQFKIRMFGADDIDAVAGLDKMIKAAE